MNDRTRNSIFFLIIGIIVVIFLVTYWNMNSYTPKFVQPCFKFRCDFSSDGNTKIIGPEKNLTINWAINGIKNNGQNDAFGKNSPVTDVYGNIYIANPNGYKVYDDKNNLLSSNGILYKYSSDGKLIWSFSNVNGAINNTPCIGNNYIYFGCDDGYLYALNSDSRLQWKYFLGGNSVLSSPTFDNLTNNVYIGTENGLVAVNNKGKLVWKYNSGNIVSCPAIDPNYNTVYFTSIDKYLYSINTNDGSLNWRYQAGDAIQSSPAIGNSGTIYFGCNDGYLYAVDSPDADSTVGILVWKFNSGVSTSQIISSPAIDTKGNIYYTGVIGSGLGSQGRLYIVNPNGTIKNYLNIDTPCDSSPLIDAKGNIFVAGGVYLYVYVINENILWNIELGNVIRSSPVLDSKGNLVIGCDDGFLYSITGDTY